MGRDQVVVADLPDLDGVLCSTGPLSWAEVAPVSVSRPWHRLSDARRMEVPQGSLSVLSGTLRRLFRANPPRLPQGCYYDAVAQVLEMQVVPTDGDRGMAGGCEQRGIPLRFVGGAWVPEDGPSSIRRRTVLRSEWTAAEHVLVSPCTVAHVVGIPPWERRLAQDVLQARFGVDTDLLGEHPVTRACLVTEHLRMRRTLPDVSGLSVDEYSELLGRDAEIVATCDRRVQEYRDSRGE